MKIRTTARFDKSYADAPSSIQRLFDKQVRFLIVNPTISLISCLIRNEVVRFE